MTDRLSIASEMRAFDHKDRGFYDSLTDQEKKKFSTFLMLKYGASVEGSMDLQEWYLRSLNERANANFFDLGRHPKLQWLICTTVSPGMGSQRHYWLASQKQDNKGIKFLAKHFPHLKQDELELMNMINSKDQLRDMARALGYSDQDIKREL